MYTWDDLRRWVKDPARTLPELRQACAAFGLPSTKENTGATRSRLFKKIFYQDDFLAESPYNPTAPAAAAPTNLVKCFNCWSEVPNNKHCGNCGATLVWMTPDELQRALTVATPEPNSEPVWVRKEGDWNCYRCGIMNRQNDASCTGCHNRRTFEPPQNGSAQQTAPAQTGRPLTLQDAVEWFKKRW